jgi:hypothetical protein
MRMGDIGTINLTLYLGAVMAFMLYCAATLQLVKKRNAQSRCPLFRKLIEEKDYDRSK